MAVTETVDTATKVVDDKIDAARDSMSDRMGRMKEKVNEVAEGVKARATELREKIRETEWQDVTQKATEYVRNNPGKSIAIAAGIGFALGLLLRRRGDD